MPSQKRKSASSHNASANKKPKTSPSKIVGGLNGDYRITGDESTTAFETFTVPSGRDDDKVIPCQERQPSSPKSPGKQDILIFTHGAGGGLENPATMHFADGYGTASRVVCFQGTMNLQSRVRNFAAVLDHLQARSPKQKVAIAVGGRSMGARAAVMVAQDRAEVKKLVLVSYPLKGQGGDVRDRILLDLPKDKEVLFVVGSEDGMCGLEELEEVRAKMKAKSLVVVVRRADHGMSLKLTGKGLEKAEQLRIVERVRKWSGRVAADWVREGKVVRDGEVLNWEESSEGDDGGELGRNVGGKGTEQDSKKKKKESVGNLEAGVQSSAKVEEDKDGDASSNRRSKRRKK